MGCLLCQVDAAARAPSALALRPAKPGRSPGAERLSSATAEPSPIIAAALEGECQNCGSTLDDRSFAWFFASCAKPAAGAKILDVGPSPALLKHLTTVLAHAQYTAISPVQLPEAALLRPPHRFLRMDVTRLSFSDGAFDYILCNSVLSYVRSDFQAMTEIHRCLGSRGVAFLSVPLVPGKSVRAGGTEKRPMGSEREWIYGDDYFERLEAAGFFVHRRSLLPGGGDAASGANLDRTVQQVLAFKFRDTMDSFLRSLP